MGNNGQHENTDLELWGLRPLRWSFRMTGDNPEMIAATLSPAELREAAEFLGLQLPENREVDELVKIFVSAAKLRNEALYKIADKSSRLGDNLKLLQDSLDLNQVEVDLIGFRAMLRLHPGFEALAGKYIGLCCDFVFHRKLARLFGVSGDDVNTALHKRGKLVGSGLVSTREGVLGPLENRLHLKQGMIRALIRPAASADELLASLLPRKREAGLGLCNYPHLEGEIRLLRDRLKTALSQRLTGVNVLLHGAPGTGKSELAAALATCIGEPLYECLGADEDDGYSRDPRARIRELAQLQRIARVAGSGVILMDEAEDLFPTAWSDADKTPTKAAVNECLERNPTPTIWISNRTRHIDEAFLRRFDLVIHVPPLPISAKGELLRRALPPETLSDREISHYANQRKLSPAMLTRIARVACAPGSERSIEVRRNLQLLSSHYLRTLGECPLPATNGAQLLEHDLGLLNTDIPLASIIATMARMQYGARILLHGPPGTGKTALGHAIAEHLDKPLLQRLASSLLSMWVGETEQNLRDMFEDARREDAVLLLDEADSFLRDRSQARARWEVTQANELLTQTEVFDGIFICTTNRLDDLDPAALRRFDLKVEFKPLKLEQRMRLVMLCCKSLGITHRIENAETANATLRQLETLTPGDAAAALRRLRLSDAPPSLDALLAALQDECRYKPGVPRSIGFVH